MRARLLRLHPRTVEKLLKLKKDAEKEGEHRVAKRIHATLLNHDGKTSGEISNLLRAPRSRVSEWLSNYDAYGFESLLEGHRTGRPPLLNKNQKTELADIVDSGPVAYGFLSGVWTSVMIAQVIQDEFRVSYDSRHVRRILDELNFSVQRPKKILAKADPVKQNRWARYTYPNIKKKLKHKGQL